MKRLFIIFLLITHYIAVSEAAHLVPCMYESGAVCTVSLSSHNGAAWTDIWTGQATTEHAVGGRSVYTATYGSNLSTSAAYFVTCECDGVSWMFAWDVTETDTCRQTTLADTVWDEQLEGTYTARQLQRLHAAFNMGKTIGGGTNTVRFRDLADIKDRITSTVDANRNRTTVIYDPD